MTRMFVFHANAITTTPPATVPKEAVNVNVELNICLLCANNVITATTAILIVKNVIAIQTAPSETFVNSQLVIVHAKVLIRKLE